MDRSAIVSVTGCAVLVSLCAIAVLAAAGVAEAQTSVLYVTDGDSNFIKAIQGGSIIDENLATGGDRPYRVAVRDTIWLGDMDADPNAEFDLNLDPTGNTSPAGVDIEEGTDGATDGVSNYTVESFVGTAGVYRYNGDWSGGELLFTVTGTQIVGITYDVVNGTFWISDQSTIWQYDLGGRQLSSFPHVGFRGSLAYEAATDTLWYVTNSGGNSIRQYSKAGALLQTLDVPFDGNVWGAEFRHQFCQLELHLDEATLRPGDSLEFSLYLKHNRPKTVVVPLAFRVEDSGGQVVLHRVTAPRTVEFGDEFDRDYAFTVPESLRPGEYTLVVGVSEMQQGKAWAKEGFTVVAGTSQGQ